MFFGGEIKLKTLTIFFILILMIGTLTPAIASESEPVYETKCGQDAIDIGQLCIVAEKIPTESIKLFSWQEI